MRTRALALAVGLAIAICFLELCLWVFGWGLLAAQETDNEIRFQDEGAIRVVTIGESTTSDYLNQAAWPRQLEKNLANRGGLFRVYNLGRPATTTTDILNRLPAQLDKFRPHIVVSMMGVNDIGLIATHDPSWWDHVKVVKLYRWIRFFAKLPPPEVSEENFSDPPTTMKIFEALRSSNPMEGIALAEKEAERLDENQRAKYFLFLSISIPDSAKRESVQVELWKRSLAARFQGGITFERILRHFYQQKKERECFAFAKTYLEHGWSATDGILLNLTKCAGLSNRDGFPSEEWQNILKDLTREEKLESYSNSELTKKNYRALHKLLKDRNITLVAMQYPTVPIEKLMEFFKSKPGEEVDPEFQDIMFVENEKNFGEALAKHPYDDIFYDRFGKTWGHATGLGQIIISQAVLPAVLDAVGRRAAK